MKASTKLAIAIGTIIFGSAGFLLYEELKKIMKYAVSFKSAKILQLTPNMINANLWFNFKNPSKLKINLNGVKYDVFINNVYATTLENNAKTIILPETTSVLGLNLTMNPTEFIKSLPNPLSAILDLKQLPLRLVMKFKVKVGPFTITIPYTYDGKLKDFV